MRTLSLLLLVGAVALSGCTSMQKYRGDQAELSEHLDVGQHIIVYEKSGRIIDMRYVLTDGDELVGSLTVDGLSSVRVRIDDIERIESEEIALGRTTGAVLGGIVLAPIAAVGAGLALADQ